MRYFAKHLILKLNLYWRLGPFLSLASLAFTTKLLIKYKHCSFNFLSWHCNWYCYLCIIFQEEWRRTNQRLRFNRGIAHSFTVSFHSCLNAHFISNCFALSEKNICLNLTDRPNQFLWQGTIIKQDTVEDLCSSDGSSVHTSHQETEKLVLQSMLTSLLKSFVPAQLSPCNKPVVCHQQRLCEYLYGLLTFRRDCTDF